MSAPESVPTVHVVDDDATFLKAVSRLLRASGYVVRTFTSARSFLEEIPAHASGCVIIDLNMPGLNGLDLQEALERASCTLPTVFLTGYGDIPTTVRALRHGAEDFLTKVAPKEDVLDAVKRAMDRDSRQRGLRAKRQAIRARFDLLTRREHEVLELVLQGALNKQIAMELDIHERTVKLHRTSITTKLSVHSVAELVRLAQEAGMFESHGAYASSPGNSARLFTG
jgi:FixJ family two-component response regulator